jgi:hypothetical protein
VKLLQNVFAYCAPRDVAAAQAWSGGGALRLLAAAADPASAAPPLRRAHALYGLCNVAVSGARRGVALGGTLAWWSEAYTRAARAGAPVDITSGCCCRASAGPSRTAEGQGGAGAAQARRSGAAR